MMVFFGNDIKVAISNSRIYKVIQQGASIQIFYDGGEMTWLSNDSDSLAPKVESSTIHYETAELAIANFRDYYTACEKNRGAFYFG